MTDTTTTLHASTPQLLKATALALAVAGAILLTTVLPAEYGIDPTGIGKALGLTALHPLLAKTVRSQHPNLPPAHQQRTPLQASSGSTRLTRTAK